MKTQRIGLGILIGMLCACSSEPEPAATVTVTTSSVCRGNPTLPSSLKSAFNQTEDVALLNQALGKPESGGLCQGQVYIAKPDVQVLIYRAWNSTNPNSRLGQWWAFDRPTGLVAEYRKNYEICYQWSPLDKLVRCSLKPGTKIVVGNGQSARCSDYLSYPVSGKLQVFIDDAAENVVNCQDFSGTLTWRPNR